MGPEREHHILKSLFLVLGLLLARSGLSAPILDAGWEVDADISASDQVLAADTDNEDGAYLYNLSGPAIFRITDAFMEGDTWTVFDFGNPILISDFVGFASPFGDNAVADAGWTSAAFGSGQVLLDAGIHSITVQGDGAGGLPARFFVRIDSVPEPGTALLIGLGIAGLGFVRLRIRGGSSSGGSRQASSEPGSPSSVDSAPSAGGAERGAPPR